MSDQKNIIYKTINPIKRCANCIYKTAYKSTALWCEKLHRRIQLDGRCHGFKKVKGNSK